MRNEDIRHDPALVQKYCLLVMSVLPIETVRVFLFNSAGRLMREFKRQKGAVNRLSCDILEIILESKNMTQKMPRSFLVLARNHPGGNHNPSSADFELSRQCVVALQPQNTTLLEHLIVSSQGLASAMPEGRPLTS